MISYRGRTGLRQYMPNSPCKYGMKIWGLCDAKNAYFYNGELYCGKTGDKAEVGQATRVALQLVEPVTNCGRTLFTDNFYTSPELASQLLKKRTYLVGIVRKTKNGIPREIDGISYQDKREPKTNKISDPRAGFLWCQTDPFMLVKYELRKNNKFVYLLSSKHAAPNVSSTVGKKPEVIHAYNSAKGGVNRMDMLIGHWSSTSRTKRWTLRVFYWLLDVIYLNAYILFKESICAKKFYGENERRRNFLKDSSMVVLSQKINNRTKDPNPNVNKHPHFRNLIKIAQLVDEMAKGPKKSKLFSNSQIERGTPMTTGRLSRSRKSIESADQPSTSTAFQLPSALELAAARIERERARKFICQMDECHGKRRKTLYKCYTCKKAICASCINRKSRNTVFCKNC